MAFLMVEDREASQPGGAGEAMVAAEDGGWVRADTARRYMGRWFTSFEGMNRFAAEAASAEELARFARENRALFWEYMEGQAEALFGAVHADGLAGAFVTGLLCGFARSCGGFYDWLECERAD